MSELLKSLCAVHSPSGEERNMKQFILSYIDTYSSKWKVKPQLFHGDQFQDCLVLVFGKPRVAAFAHMDTTGFTVRYQNQLIPIGSPEVEGGEKLIGFDSLGEIECLLDLNEEFQAHYHFGRAIMPGTSLTYKSNFVEDRTYINSPYLDDRVGLYNLLKIAETLENGALAFSCWEEHGGGSVPYLVKFLYEKYQISRMLISDITWISEGIVFEEGVVISYRDRNIPRKSFVEEITKLAIANQIPYQVEVEAHGSSDGREIQLAPYPIDWCFIGPPVEHAHSNHEIVAKEDLKSMISFYTILMKQL
jgi:putative aminopeptidase FrvX